MGRLSVVGKGCLSVLSSRSVGRAAGGGGGRARSEPGRHIAPLAEPTSADGTGKSRSRSGQLKAQFQAPAEITGQAVVDLDRFFDVLMLPSESPMISRREELKRAEVDEDKFFRQHVRTAKNYNLLIRAQAERKPLPDIEATFEHMRAHGIAPNLELYTSMLVACAKNKHPERAEHYLALMKQDGLEPNIWSYTALAQAYTRATKLDQAFGVLERLKDVSLRPNVVLYTCLIHGCLLARDVDRAWDTFDHMRQREGIEPDEVTFTLMITACAQKAQVERARNLMEEMELLQLKPTEVTYNAQMDACAQRRDYYAEAFLNLERMKAAGFRPDEVTYSTLLHASAKNGDVRMAQAIFENMNDSGMLAVKPEASRHWNTLLSAYASTLPQADPLTRAQSLKTASRIVQTMKQVGQQPDLYTANTLLSLHTRAHRIRQAETFFEEAFLHPRSLNPAAADETAATATASSLPDADSVPMTAPSSSSSSSSGPANTPTGGAAGPERTLWVFPERFAPDVVSYTCLVQLYADTRRPEKALRTWQLMRDAGVEPNMRTYEYMVRCLARSGYLNSAMKILREMRGKGFVPSHQVAALLLQRTLGHPELREEVRRLTDLPVPSKLDKKDILAIRLRRASRRDNDPFATKKRPRALPLHRPV